MPSRLPIQSAEPGAPALAPTPVTVRAVAVQRSHVCSPESRARATSRPLLVVVVFFLISALLLPGSLALKRVVSVQVNDSARLLHILEGSVFTTDESDSDTDPITFLPDCKEYEPIPCTCSLVRFDGAEGNFWPSFERVWHLPTLERMLTIQVMQRRTPQGFEYVGPYFWHSSSFGNFKNSFDVTAFVASAYSGAFNEECERDAECLLSRALISVLNWVVTLLQFSLGAVPDQLADYANFFEDIGGQQMGFLWGNAPWHLLLERPAWVQSFLALVDRLQGLMRTTGTNGQRISREESTSSDGIGQAEGGGGSSQVGEAGYFDEAIELLGSAGPKCSQRPRELHAVLMSIDVRVEEQAHLKKAMEAAQGAVFYSGCPAHPVAQLILFANLIRPLLPSIHTLPSYQPWPAMYEVAKPTVSFPIFRFPNDAVVVHRVVPGASLEILGADLVEVGGHLQVDLLWMAISDDDCIMVGTNFHNPGETYQYYSFAHTLSASHLVQWTCQVSDSPLSRTTRAQEARWPMASTVSFSGFLSVTTCQVAPELERRIRAAGPNGDISLDVWLRSARAGESVISTSGDPGPWPKPSQAHWRPEPIRLVPQPPPLKRRILSACVATLHGADRLEKILPHALEDWINYHLLVGIEHFTLFDVDGSFGKYLTRFVDEGTVTYHGNFAAEVSSKLGKAASGLKNPKEHRSMLLEPHALDTCVWANRHVSNWVVVLHSFEEFLHSPREVKKHGSFNLSELVPRWASDYPNIAYFELFQEPMGGRKESTAQSVVSTWQHVRGLKLEGKTALERLEASHRHFQPFAWIVDPVNVLQTAVHYAQARSEEQVAMVMVPELLRVNHVVDLGSNASRCETELGGCLVEEVGASMAWAEEQVVARRWSNREVRVLPRGAAGCPKGFEIRSVSECHAGLRALGLPVGPAWEGSAADIPPFCSLREEVAGGGEHAHFNRLDSSSTSVGRSDLAPVCRGG